MDNQQQPQGELKEHTVFQVKKPHKYAIIMLNDDFTPMEFVVEILVTVFHKQNQEAFNLMMTVHNNGEAVIGEYTYDMAATKRAKAMSLAREAGYPLRVELKEV